MFDTPSLLESLETDNTQRRVASRRALALAHNRVERNLGGFLRAAQTEEEFFERLGLLQEDFDGYVTTASAEVGHDHPEHIAAALKDHFRLAVAFKETPAEEQEKEDEEEDPVTSSHKWAISGVNMNMMDPLGQGVPQNPNAMMQPGTGQAMGDAGAMQQPPPAMGQPQGPPTNPQDMSMLQGIPQPPLSPDTGAGVGQVAGEPPPATPQPPPPVNPFTGGVNAAPNSQPNYNPNANDPQIPENTPWMAPQYQPDTPPGAPYEGAPAQSANTNSQEAPPVWTSSVHAQFTEDKQSLPLAKEASPYQDMHEPESGPTEESAFGAGFNNHPCKGCGAPYDAHGPNGECPSGANPYGPMEQTHAPFGQVWQEEQRNRLGSNEHDLVVCPECGGDGKTAGATKCPKCAGKGRVVNFGDSMTDAYGADIKVAGPYLENPQGPVFYNQYGVPDREPDPIRNQEGYIRGGIKSPYKDISRDEGYEQIPYEVNPDDPRTRRRWDRDDGLQIAPNLPSLEVPPGAPVHQGRQAGDGNTDLGGPEPKMDKRQWTPTNPAKPKMDGVEKDPTEVIGPMRNDDKLQEIDDGLTTEKLPTQDGDEPFAKNNMEMAPHTRTWGDKGQTDPVTRESLSKADDVYKGNPLTELLSSEFPPDSVVHEALLRIQ